MPKKPKTILGSAKDAAVIAGIAASSVVTASKGDVDDKRMFADRQKIEANRRREEQKPEKR